MRQYISISSAFTARAARTRLAAISSFTASSSAT